jgi:hypothetical protein
MSCTVHRRRAATDAARAAEAVDPAVVGFDAIAPADSQHDCWTLELTIAADHAPASVVSELVHHDLDLRPSGTRNGFFVLVATV